jgi:hypothetical protein
MMEGKKNMTPRRRCFFCGTIFSKNKNKYRRPMRVRKL